MAFHVACPITCKKICYCDLGFHPTLHISASRDLFFDEVHSVARFLTNPSAAQAVCNSSPNLKIPVPKVVRLPLTPAAAPVAGIDVEEAALLLSTQTKRVAMQREAAVASLAAEDYARRFESGDVSDAPEDFGGDQGLSNVNVMCRICLKGEIKGSERSRTMLSCKDCGKKYHRTCIKSWGKRRDLFNWSSWSCPSCRVCEVCHRTGDQNKFMFCKRCDGAYHCYCQHPPHKTVTTGPYLCPKHTKCHSCGSTVPGNGLSLRWFLGYTCCDACGRLFTKGNYCPVCLKVYRDSESTPMVCCDNCQRWVHCNCDSISDEKYMQFQVDNNLQYMCATCRGECCQVKDLEDAVKELWRRRDEVDQDLIASLRVSAGLPAEEELYYISSDGEKNGSIVLKDDGSRSMKLSSKGVIEKSPKKSKDYRKKFSSKKHTKKKGLLVCHVNDAEAHEVFENLHDAKLSDYASNGDKIHLGDHATERRDKGISGVVDVNIGDGTCSIDQPGALKRKFGDDSNINNEDRTSRTLKLKSRTPLESVKVLSGTNTMKAPKLVIHLGGWNKNPSKSPLCDTSNYQRELELKSSSNLEPGERYEPSGQLKSPKHDEGEGGRFKSRSVTSEEVYVPDKFMRRRGTIGDEPTLQMGGTLTGRRNSMQVMPVKEVATSRVEKVSLRNQVETLLDVSGEGLVNSNITPVVSLEKDSKPLLKLKLKNPYLENQISLVVHKDEDKSLVKGQRSKRKRPSNLDKLKLKEEGTSKKMQSSLVDATMDVSWILLRLGKDAIGKRVEVYQPSDNSWHKGIVADVVEGKSKVSINLDDGRSKTVELGKHGVRFVDKKQKQLKK